MKRYYSFIIVSLITVILILSGGYESRAQALRKYAFNTGGATGSFYLLAVPLCEYINLKSDKIRMIPAQSGGSVENYSRANSGDIPMGLTGSGVIRKAWMGQAPFKERMRNPVIIGPNQTPSTVHILVRADSGVTKLEDLVGKYYGVGAPGSTGAVMSTTAFKYAGIEDKVKQAKFGFSEIADMVKNRTLVGYARTSSVPWGGYEEVNVTWRGARVLDLKDIVYNTSLLKENRLYIPVKIPANTYKGVPNDIVSFGEKAWTIASPSVSDEVIYEFCLQAYSQGAVEYMQKRFNAWDGYPLNPEPLKGLPIALHPGAKKFWKEKGVEIPEPIFKK